MDVWQPGLTLATIEKLAILKAFAFFQQNKTHTAQALGISIMTLRTKLTEYEKDAMEAKAREDDRQAKELDWQKRASGTQALSQFGVGSQTGVHVESSPKPTAQHAVPVRIETEVQEMSSKQTAKSNPRKNG